MIRRTIREWERIGYGSDDTSIPEAQADRIAAVAQASPFSGRGGEGVLEHGRKGLRARGVVGVIATPGCQLEILPKIEGSHESDVTDAALRQRLVHMLAVVHDLPIDAGTMTPLGWQHETVLEILIRLFCKKLLDAVRQGMPHQYVEFEDDLPALRGRLNVMRQFSSLAVSPQKLACRFDARSSDIPLNQIMRATVSKLSRIANATSTLSMLRELNFAYADVTDIPATALRWDQISVDRSNRRWQGLLELARLFLSGKHQQTSSGDTTGYSLLFQMNVLFEKYVARLLALELSGSGLRVSSQGGLRSCLFDGDTGRFSTRPDIVIRNDGQIDLIIDTKWKRIVPRIDDPKQGVSQSDVYQMMAYSQLYECQAVMLLYPHHSDLPEQPILQYHSIGAPDAPEKLFFATVDLSGSASQHRQRIRELIGRCRSLTVH